MPHPYDTINTITMGCASRPVVGAGRHLYNETLQSTGDDQLALRSHLFFFLSSSQEEPEEEEDYHIQF